MADVPSAELGVLTSDIVVINIRKCPSNTSAVAAPDVSADASSDVLILQNIIESDRLPNLETVLL